MSRSTPPEPLAHETSMRSGETLRYGLFLQSSHPPERTLGDAIDRVLEQIRWADELGFSEAWLGEHLTAVWEPVFIVSKRIA